MGYISEKYLKDKPKAYFAFQIAVSIVLIFFFYYFFSTQCMDTWNDGYDFCRAEMGEYQGLNITYYPNGSIEKIDVVSEFADLPFNPSLQSFS